MGVGVISPHTGLLSACREWRVASPCRVHRPAGLLPLPRWGQRPGPPPQAAGALSLGASSQWSALLSACLRCTSPRTRGSLGSRLTESWFALQLLLSHWNTWSLGEGCLINTLFTPRRVCVLRAGPVPEAPPLKARAKYRSSTRANQGLRSAFRCLSRGRT